MASLFPFRALRPDVSVASAVASVPYDVVSTAEARELAAGNPLSFLHVTRSDIDLPAGTDPYDDAVYTRAAANLTTLIQRAPLITDEEPSLYVYRLRMGDHEQVGLAGCFSVEEYERGLIRKHEKTRPDKENDRTRHILALRAQTGLVFLAHRASVEVESLVQRVVSGLSTYDFQAADGIRHTLWRVAGADCDAMMAAFASIDTLYIADGHHRAASASRAHREMTALGTHSPESGRFVAVAFPDDGLQILPYNRVLKDLGGRSPEDVLRALGAVASFQTGGATPDQPGRVSMFLAGQWYSMVLPPPGPAASRAASLDVDVLQRQILEPVFGIGDPRTDPRIEFVGGSRGTAELERLVTSGRVSAAFSLDPVRMADIMAIADEGGIMPPKSTWFEPKLRDGLLIHRI